MANLRKLMKPLFLWGAFFALPVGVGADECSEYFWNSCQTVTFEGDGYHYEQCSGECWMYDSCCLQYCEQSNPSYSCSSPVGSASGVFAGT